MLTVNFVVFASAGSFTGLCSNFRVVVEWETSGGGEITVCEGEWKGVELEIARRVDASDGKERKGGHC